MSAPRDSAEQLRQLQVLGETMIKDLHKASPRQSVLTPKPYAELYEHSQAALLAAGDSKKPMLSGVNLEGCRETARVNVGIREAMSELYRQFGWDRLLGARRMSDNRMLKELVLARLAQIAARTGHGAGTEGTRRRGVEPGPGVSNDGLS